MTTQELENILAETCNSNDLIGILREFAACPKFQGNLSIKALNNFLKSEPNSKALKEFFKEDGEIVKSGYFIQFKRERKYVASEQIVTFGYCSGGVTGYDFSLGFTYRDKQWKLDTSKPAEWCFY